TFGAGHIPPFPKSVFDLKDGKSKFKNILSDDIEDAEYVDVSDINKTSGESRKPQSYDSEKRAKEIYAYADKKSKDLNVKKDPMMEFFLLLIISFGAEWSDKNPEQKFRTSMERSKAFYAEIEKHQNEVEAMEGKKSPEIHLLRLWQRLWA
ncbi:MAG: hypothetical protein K2H72_03140, partial [Muribaculaceae bacterium]|nr:hypothetical protein [Muribaculaceae bacterium]